MSSLCETLKTVRAKITKAKQEDKVVLGVENLIRDD